MPAVERQLLMPQDRQEPELPKLWLLSKGGKDLQLLLYHNRTRFAVRFPYDSHTLSRS
jgi:hypothetical protein